MFKLNPKYKLREEDNGDALMADTSNGTVYVINSVAMYILTLLEKNTPQGEIITMICQKYKGAKEEVVADDLKKFTSNACEQGFLFAD